MDAGVLLTVIGMPDDGASGAGLARACRIRYTCVFSPAELCMSHLDVLSLFLSFPHCGFAAQCRQTSAHSSHTPLLRFHPHACAPPARSRQSSPPSPSLPRPQGEFGSTTAGAWRRSTWGSSTRLRNHSGRRRRLLRALRAAVAEGEAAGRSDDDVVGRPVNPG